MRKVLNLFLLLSSTTIIANDVTSHTFFSVRPQSQGVMPETLALTRDRMTAREDGCNGTLRVSFFGGRTLDSISSDLAKFFMPFGKTTLLAGEHGSTSVLENKADIIANYFGVQTASTANSENEDIYVTENLTFESKLCFAPRQSVFGFGIFYKQLLSSSDDGTGAFVYVGAPIVRVKNNLFFKEQILNAGGGEVQEGYVGSIGDALRGNTVFGNKKFCCGKIPSKRINNNKCDSNCALTKTRIADIDARFGYVWTANDECHKEGYIGIIIPTGNKPSAEYIFEPIVGNNKHFGLTLGGMYDFELWSNEKRSVKLAGAAHWQYLFKNCQKRSFDLIDKQWSRYIWVYPNAQATAITDIAPGINYFTQNMYVWPHCSLDATAAVVVTEGGFCGEVGYNFYARQAETVCLACPWKEGPGIAGIDVANRNQLTTKNNATMSRFAPVLGSIDVDVDRRPDPEQYSFVPIKACDLNLNSAAHPAYISHIVYGALSYRWDEREYPVFIGIGASQEFGADNTILKRWKLWGTLGFSY